MKLYFDSMEEPYYCTKAIKGTDFIILYNGDIEVGSFIGISDFSGYRLEGGEYSSPEPTPEERTQSIIDYNLMMGNLDDPESEVE